MRRLSPLVAVASIAVLAAAPSGLRAQGTPPSVVDSVINNENHTGDCRSSASGTTVNGPGTISSTGCSSVSGTYNGQPYTGSATSSATPGTSGNVTAHAELHTTGTSASTLFADAWGTYYRYFNFFGPEAPNVEKIVFTSAVQVTRTTDDPGGTPNVEASVAFGLLNPDNSFDLSSEFTSGGGSLNCANHPSTPCDPSFSSTVATADLGTGVYSFFYQVIGDANVTVVNTDPNSFADIIVLDPVPEFFFFNGQSSPGIMTDDPNRCPTGQVCYNYNPPGTAPTNTPEPATVVLLATGMAGLGGFVRRKRRAIATA